ncbi:CopG family transcriptional regulator [Klenkia taihuensis]|uniref:Ribbon-helix-helix protein, copG family n=2 Tax=Klenkia taihuensis TaxID=1225127 RepID=A0A1I1HKV2_9ACTN|nr:CopG family transcriptional regulator [Klenkia taihuensis]GHE09136.1 hypothetical protein GCM10011381_12600 [Klenkia taihuensis]SFC24481.1 hypothetical protein SAMN05661030_0475 [Klenkia taihuensis]
MAMTLRLSAAQSEALRIQARAEGASMQDVAKRAVSEYLDHHGRTTPLDLVLDTEIPRYADALAELARWTD